MLVFFYCSYNLHVTRTDVCFAYGLVLYFPDLLTFHCELLIYSLAVQVIL